MTTGYIMGFPNTSAAVSKTDGGLLYYPLAGVIYGVAQTGGATSGIRKWDSWPNGNELRARNLADIAHGVTMYAVSCRTFATQQLIMSNGASNSAALNGFALPDMSYTGSFGVNSSSLSNSDTGRILASNYLVSILDSKGRDVVVATPIRSGAFTGGAEINCIYWGAKTNVRATITENAAVLGAVPDGSGSNAWALGYNLGAATMHLYKITGPGAVTNQGAITPANIDATWTNVTAVWGMAVDQKDGNLLCGFETTDVVANQHYLVKINSTTAAIMWKIAIGGGFSYSVGRGEMRHSIITKGKFYLLGGDGNLYQVDTIAGTADTSLSLFGSGPTSINGTQISEDIDGSVIWYGGWTEIGLHPTYLGTYCGTLGNHGGSEMVWRFWPNLPSPPGTLMKTTRKRAWSFTLDGHVFYVLDLGQEGTFLWDKTTGQWAQFITFGYTAWNFANGCMWGQRIVAGDQTTTDVWEMLPATSLFDNGATEIVHVVSGGVATRNRIYHSVESFTLAASVAGLLDPNGASVTLAFSDDQGKTWTQMDTVTLTGATNQEVAWLSLGAFCNPGRIFKITDCGAFLRIDGADASIDNFDEQPPAGG